MNSTLTEQVMMLMMVRVILFSWWILNLTKQNGSSDLQYHTVIPNGAVSQNWRTWSQDLATPPKVFLIESVNHILGLGFLMIDVKLSWPHMTLRIWTEHLWCHLILELFFHPKYPYFATITGVLAPGMALVHTSLLASDIYRYMPGKTREYGN